MWTFIALFGAALALASDLDSSKRPVGMADLVDGQEACHGFLISPRRDMPESAPAYLLTAGHCLPSVTIRAHEIYLGGHAGEISIRFSSLINSTVNSMDLTATYVPYARSNVDAGSNSGQNFPLDLRKDRDVAVIALNRTLLDLKARGVSPLFLAEEAPQSGQELWSFSPTWEELRLSVTNPFRLLVPAARDPEQESGGLIGFGSCGSPLFSPDERQVYALVAARSNGAPNQTGYFSRLWDLGPCFDRDGYFDASHLHCPLEKPHLP